MKTETEEVMKAEPADIDEVTDVLTDIVKSVVKDPAKAGVKSMVHGALVAFVIKVDQEDVRRVVGKQGKHFKAISLLASEAMRLLGSEAHVAIDEKTPPRSELGSLNEVYGFGDYGGVKKFKNLSLLIKRTVAMFCEDKDKVTVKVADIALTSLLDVTVTKADYPNVYGKTIDLDGNPDGHIINAVKNIFDGIGKNNGRVIKIVVRSI